MAWLRSRISRWLARLARHSLSAASGMCGERMAMADAPSENQYIFIDQPARFVQRITLNRPEKRNAMSNDLRIELFRALEAAYIDDGVRVIIIRGAGKCFSSGYDVSFERERWPYHNSSCIGRASCRERVCQ